ncbi:MAG: hypothetical protein ACD_46C00480G0001 [uncultured bacterium]|nr:MAG: hypothetical protein ACD_46C00480G0001 [uncultured bacterium]
MRPGEKLHEVMCPESDSHLVLEFADHYLIQPTIQFAHEVEFTINCIGEVGKPVWQGFEYNSSTNTHKLDAMILDEIIKV